MAVVVTIGTVLAFLVMFACVLIRAADEELCHYRGYGIRWHDLWRRSWRNE